MDAALDTIVQAARRAYGDAVTIAVVSDHGFIATHTEVHVGAALVTAGLVTVPPDGEERPIDWRAMVWPSGGSAAIVLRDSTSAVLRDSVERALRAVAADSANGIAAVLDRRALDAAGAYPGATWVLAFRPGYRVGYRLRGPLRRPVTGGSCTSSSSRSAPEPSSRVNARSSGYPNRVDAAQARCARVAAADQVTVTDCADGSIRRSTPRSVQAVLGMHATTRRARAPDDSRGDSSRLSPTTRAPGRQPSSTAVARRAGGRGAAALVGPGREARSVGVEARGRASRARAGA